MIRTIALVTTGLFTLTACSDEQVREMAQVGTYDGQPVFQITTEIRLPASDEKIQERQQEILTLRANRLCPGGYKEVGRSRVREIQQYYDNWGWGGGWGGPFGSYDPIDWDLNTYTTLQQDIQIICTAGQPT